MIELNEAFAAQGLAVLRQLGLADDDARVNPNGGAIALGHPLGMSGARLALTATEELQRSGGRYGACHHVHRRRPGDRAGARAGVMDEAAIWAVLEAVPDPEIPVVSVVDLGIVREVDDGQGDHHADLFRLPGDRRSSNAAIREALDAAGYRDVAIETVLSPPWTTDWISEDGQGEAARLRHRPARTGQGRDLPAMRLDRHRRSQPLRLNPVQGAMALQGLPGAVRPVQVPLI